MQLGRLEPVDLRSVWENEARDFTPWLLEAADRLGDTLGIDLELNEAEHPVGGFSLDLIGRDLTHDAVLIVENQLAATDHPHLGQILTYAAGTDASTIVWIAASFREEHRQAIDWLNEHTHPDIRFFGVEVEAVRIGDSMPAPLFRVIAEPNDWQKQVRTANNPESAKAVLYQAFWTKYLDAVRDTHPDWSRARTASRQNWMDFPSPIKGSRINPSFANGRRLRHEIYLDCGDHGRNKALFHHLQDQAATFESAYGAPLEWEELPHARASRIAEYFADADVTEEDRHVEFIAWFIGAGERLRKALEAVDTYLPLGD